jgi:hypothetical protein
LNVADTLGIARPASSNAARTSLNAASGSPQASVGCPIAAKFQCARANPARFTSAATSTAPARLNVLAKIPRR